MPTPTPVPAPHTQSETELTSSAQSEGTPIPPAILETPIIETPKEALKPPPEPSPQATGDNQNTGISEELGSQTALIAEFVSEDKKSIFSSGWFWFSAALFFGTVSAGGVFAIRKFIL
ncbi:MAG: hypothetical protein AAB642_00175 [Patescibacteria group bacterium]